RLGFGAHTAVSAPKPRAMCGREHVLATQGILDQAASLITDQLSRGTPLESIRAPCAGFKAGPPTRVRAWSVEQLLDAAVRSVSSIGSADAILCNDEPIEDGRSTHRTAAFLRKLRSEFSGHDRARRDRFEQRMPNVP